MRSSTINAHAGYEYRTSPFLISISKVVIIVPYSIRRAKPYSRTWVIYDERTGQIVGHSVGKDAQRKASISARIRNRYDKEKVK